ncbi:hypothetical protein NliqN6_4364 [Naganishia liquefaciens]|uniref:Lanthionine synthetase C family protein n=1 Tax=Naganishia liquefaciens TaxID=104408 RepID=A0A8H3TVM1_9TREE|nr:hypothetical protein NliqN6_4364 [Naganishia liquefaciens]
MCRHISPPDGHRIDVKAELRNSLDRLVTRYPPAALAPSGGLYAGLLSVVFLLWKLDKLIPQEHLNHGFTIKYWLDAYWTQAKRLERALLGQAGMASFKIRPWRCGVGEDAIVYTALHVVFALEAGQTQSEAEVRAFCQAVKQVVGSASISQVRKHGKPASNEWLYGRAGTLYLLRMIRRVAGQSGQYATLVPDIDECIHAVIEEILSVPRPWMWHGKPYLGAVHGSAGIVSQVVQSMQAIDLQDQRLLDSMQADVERILDLQMPSGNWPSSIPTSNAHPHQDRLVQFCHGSPGIVACLKQIQSAYPSLSNRISTAISCAEADILSRGWLTKEPCLCHGASGNALALGTKARRMSFLQGATERSIQRMEETGELNISDSPEGLYTGVAGRVWVWALCSTDEDLQGLGAFLGFDDV